MKLRKKRSNREERKNRKNRKRRKREIINLDIHEGKRTVIRVRVRVTKFSIYEKYCFRFSYTSFLSFFTCFLYFSQNFVLFLSTLY